ncbi:hypothetical protein BD770DRAFT_396186 [Pilaira anomala]|nr:hypothetical protein BD770DRAFT_396186 [Pilaira anomala]
MRITSIFLLSTSISFVQAIIPTPRYNGGCVAVTEQLHCYGGTSNQKTTSNHFVFDLSKDFPMVGSIIQSWTEITTPANDFQVEPNSLFSIVPLNDSFLIHGGLGYGSSTNLLKNITTVYNVLDNTWHTINSTNQTMMAPSREDTATLDLSNRIWIWGGISDNRTSVNLTNTEYHDDFQVLDLNNMAWSFPDNTKTSYPPARLAHTATLDRSGQSIFYIGGLKENDENKLVSVPMNEILEYHIGNNTWTIHHSPSNSTIPSPRRLHTATQIPDADLIFVYGGSATGIYLYTNKSFYLAFKNSFFIYLYIDDSKTVADFSYLLNTTSFEWTAVNILSTGAGPRFGHSGKNIYIIVNDMYSLTMYTAVLYKNSLFIVFGADTFGTLRNDFSIIDIKHWQWVSNFKTNGDYPTASISPSSSVTFTATNTNIAGSNDQTTTSAANSNSQAPIIAFNYMKTIYLMIGVFLIIFTFL